MHFMDELLLEAEKAEEKQRLEMTKLRADQVLMAIQLLEDKSTEVKQLFVDEMKILEEYRDVEQERLNKKIRWLAWNLEQFMRQTDEKTINLPHGTIKLRMGRDKVDVIDIQKFLSDQANQKFLRSIPESYQPDLQAISQHIKQTGAIPDGVNLIPAETKFHYSTLKRSNEDGKPNEQQRPTEA